MNQPAHPESVPQTSEQPVRSREEVLRELAAATSEPGIKVGEYLRRVEELERETQAYELGNNGGSQ